MPLGITTTYAKNAAMIEALLTPKHFGSVSFFSLPLSESYTPHSLEHSFREIRAHRLICNIGNPVSPHCRDYSRKFSAIPFGEFSILYRVPPEQLFME
jgi:hypothetical protein